MADSTFKGILNSWGGGEVTIVNPQSFRRGAITDAIDLETFSAQLINVGDDFAEVQYEAKKKGQVESVTQYIPFTQIRRLSVWGSERLIQL